MQQLPRSHLLPGHHPRRPAHRRHHHEPHSVPITSGPATVRCPHKTDLLPPLCPALHTLVFFFWISRECVRHFPFALQSSILTILSAGQVPAGYIGFTWNKFDTLVGSVYGGGYTTGTVSPPNVAYDGFGDATSFSYPGGTFDLVSLYLTGAFPTGEDGSVTVTGSVGGTTDATIDRSSSRPRQRYLFAFTGFIGLNNVTMIPDVAGNRHQYAMDNLAVIQYPS